MSAANDHGELRDTASKAAELLTDTPASPALWSGSDVSRVTSAFNLLTEALGGASAAHTTQLPDDPFLLNFYVAAELLMNTPQAPALWAGRDVASVTAARIILERVASAATVEDLATKARTFEDTPDERSITDRDTILNILGLPENASRLERLNELTRMSEDLPGGYA